MTLARHGAGFKEVHAGSFRRGIFLQPLDELRGGIDGGWAVSVASAAYRSAARNTILRTEPPLVDRLAVRQAAISIAGHRQPRVGEAPAERWILLAVVHVAIDFFTVNFLHVVGEEIGDVLIGRPVDGNAEFIAVFLLESSFQFRLLEPVVTEPIEVCELLI